VKAFVIHEYIENVIILKLRSFGYGNSPELLYTLLYLLLDYIQEITPIGILWKLFHQIRKKELLIFIILLKIFSEYSSLLLLCGFRD